MKAECRQAQALERGEKQSSWPKQDRTGPGQACEFFNGFVTLLSPKYPAVEMRGAATAAAAASDSIKQRRYYRGGRLSELALSLPEAKATAAGSLVGCPANRRFCNMPKASSSISSAAGCFTVALCCWLAFSLLVVLLMCVAVLLLLLLLLYHNEENLLLLHNQTNFSRLPADWATHTTLEAAAGADWGWLILLRIQ